MNKDEITATADTTNNLHSKLFPYLLAFPLTVTVQRSTIHWKTEKGCVISNIVNVPIALRQKPKQVLSLKR